MLNTRIQGNSLISLDHKLESTLKGLRDMGDKLNNPVLQDPMNDVVNRTTIYPYPVPHVPVLNFVRKN